jgi:hypothetical protein
VNTYRVTHTRTDLTSKRCFPIIKMFVGLEVLVEVVTRSPIFWNITPYSPMKFGRRFIRATRLNL